MRSLKNTVAWVTGAGTGIGQAGALALARDGAVTVLSGRRPEPLEETAEMIRNAGGEAVVEPMDIADATAVDAVVRNIADRFGRLDILVNSAGINVPERHWTKMTPDGWRQVISIDLDGAFYCCSAVMPTMRAQKDGLIINISSWAGRFVSYLTGPAYTAAKHGMVALTSSINHEEFRNGIRACSICPAEVATPILDKRPVPVSDADKARMLQQEDLGETILFVARMPAHVCVNEILISPTHNRGYMASPDMVAPAPD